MGPACRYSCWRIPQAPFANYTKDPHLVCSRHIWRFPWSELSCQTLNEFQESLSWAAKMGWYQPQKVLGLSSNNWESPGSFGSKPMWDGKEELSTVPPTNIYSCLLCAQPPTHLSTTIRLHSCQMPLQTGSDAGGSMCDTAYLIGKYHHFMSPSQGKGIKVSTALVSLLLL